MTKNQKFRVYLAGPISGCNEAQRSQWRNEVKTRYSRYFEFLDPTSKSELRNENASSWDVVIADLKAIENADGMIANMWRESIGTAIGMVHAQRAGKPVIIADPNKLGNRTASFYADAITDNPLKAAKALLTILRDQRSWDVVKHTPRKAEPFDRQKLVNALCAVCREAGQDDVVIPRLALPEIFEKLKNSTEKIGNQITSQNIDDAVIVTFKKLGKDPANKSQVFKLIPHWESMRKRGSFGSNTQVEETRQNYEYGSPKVPVYSGSKSHATIWGHAIQHLNDVPSPQARRVFELIVRVRGITRITFGPFGHKEEHASTCAWLGESETSHVLDGKLFDKGEKGTSQSFQVHVQFDSDKPAILNGIIESLKSAKLWLD